MKGRIRRPDPAIVIAVVAIIVALTGTALAAKKLPKNSVGPRQLKSKSVTTGKFANNAVTSAKVTTLSGDDIDIAHLGTVPSAGTAVNVQNANTVTGHAAGCPGGAVLIRGVCYDAVPHGPVLGVKAAADACAAQGGMLPTVTQLLSIRAIVNLGSGLGTHSVFADSYYYDNFEPFTVVVNSSGQEAVLNENKAKVVLANYEYVCAYPLVR